nr:integrase, catalytic region, zinc finger, CCHC-type, peptidase aspartic, catalytic [Tanacetum cinerariifolium]
MVIHNAKTEIMRLVVAIECVGKTADAFNKATASFDDLQPEQVDLNYVHALNEPHLHEICVVPSKHEADQHFSMKTLANKAILSGADNRPPMLEKDMYVSWKSLMELYIMNRHHGRMILESVENGPLLWPTIEEIGMTRPKKYSESSATKAIQADCDVKETNIIIQ